MTAFMINRKESARSELLRLMGGTLSAAQILDEVLADIDDGTISAETASEKLGLIDAVEARFFTLTDLLWEAA